MIANNNEIKIYLVIPPLSCICSNYSSYVHDNRYCDAGAGGLQTGWAIWLSLWLQFQILDKFDKYQHLGVKVIFWHDLQTVNALWVLKSEYLPKYFNEDLSLVTVYISG